MVLPFSPITSVILFRQALDMNRVGKWSRVSRKTRLKIGLAISRDLKCKTCKTQKLAKVSQSRKTWKMQDFKNPNQGPSQ